MINWKKLFTLTKNQELVSTNNTDLTKTESTLITQITDQKAEDDKRLSIAKQMHREGNIEGAETVYLDILRHSPDHADAQHMLAIVCLHREQFNEAETFFKRAIALDKEQADYYSNYGSLLSGQNRLTEAYDSFKQAIKLNPKHLPALSNAIVTLLSIGNFVEAKTLCLQMILIDPENIEARLHLSSIFLTERDIHAAIDVLRVALGIEPEHVHLLIQLASALELVNQLDEALKVIEKADSLQSGIPRVYLFIGLICRRLGKFDKAEQQLKIALDLKLSEKEQVEAFNQLGLTLDAKGKINEAFNAFQNSNNIMAKTIGNKRANGSVFLNIVAANKKYFTAEKLAILSEIFLSDNSFQPIFFIGFPRSGTTLMEQILKAHPQLITTDELSPLTAVINEIKNLNCDYPKELEKLSRDDFIRLRHFFYDFCENNFGELTGKLLVDKLPLNIVHLGLAKLLFPQAKFIIALRDPRDACLSCFIQKFEVNEAMANFLDLHTTALAYEAVMELWLHYRGILDESWFEYRYEDLVDKFDETVSNVLNFIGVGWNEDIRNYRQPVKQRMITTPSYRDVTAPINKKGLARWRAYHQELAPILPKLAPFVEIFGYEN